MNEYAIDLELLKYGDGNNPFEELFSLKDTSHDGGLLLLRIVFIFRYDK